MLICPFSLLDHAEAAGEEELVYTLGLNGQCTGKGTAPKDLAGRRPIEVFMCSVKNKIGYGDGVCI